MLDDYEIIILTVWKSKSPVNNSIAIQPTPQISDSSSQGNPNKTSGARYCLVLIIPSLFSVAYVALPKSITTK